MEGFVIAQIDEDSQEPQQFWQGTVLGDELDSATIYTDRSTARAELGGLQRQFNDSEFKLLKVERTLKIVE